VGVKRHQREKEEGEKGNRDLGINISKSLILKTR